MNGFSVPIVCYLSLPTELVDVGIFCINIDTRDVENPTEWIDAFKTMAWQKIKFSEPLVSPSLFKPIVDWPAAN